MAGKPKTMCRGAAYEARCRMMWDMEAMWQVGEPLLVGVVFGFPATLIHKPDCFIGKLCEHGATKVDEAG